jgi:citrate lyase subunit beta/citryl-CoA lyase
MRRSKLSENPSLRLAWLFGAGANAANHDEMTVSGAQVLIQDLEDFTPPPLRPAARLASQSLFERWRAAPALVCVRINSLETEGLVDLAAVLPLRPDIIAYPKADGAAIIRTLDQRIADHERALGLEPGRIEILPVCETALGVVTVREMAAASARVRSALLGAEDLATDLAAERGPDAIELDHARRRFLLECRAAGLEPVDAPYTWSDVEGAVTETRYARRLGYRCKSMVRPSHVLPVMQALSPSQADIAHAQEIVAAFEQARAEGHERALVRGQWVEVPTWLNAQRLLVRAASLAG